MEKPKAPPRDYDADLRFAPPPKSATRKELRDRTDGLIKAIFFGKDTPRQEPEEG